MRIAVFGAGGVGGYFGGRLAQAGEEVVFIARGEHLKALQTVGLRVELDPGRLRRQASPGCRRPALDGYGGHGVIGGESLAGARSSSRDAAANR